MSGFLIRTAERLRGFVAWWSDALHEGWATLPGVAPHEEWLVAAGGDDGFALSHWRGDVCRPLAGPRPPRARLALRLAESTAMRQRFALPLEARRNLGEIMALQIERVTPFRAADTCFDWRVVASDPAQGLLTVELVAVPRYLVDDAVAALGARLGAPDIVDVGDPAEVAPGDIDLSRPRLPPPKTRLAAAAVVALLLTAVLAVPLWQKQALTAALAETAEARHRDARAVLAVQDALRRAQEVERTVAARRSGAVSRLALLDEMSRLVPDDTWLGELHVEGGSLRISGYSAQPSALIGILEASPMFRGVTFASPVVQNPKDGRAQFFIALELVESPS